MISASSLWCGGVTVLLGALPKWILPVPLVENLDTFRGCSSFVSADASPADTVPIGCQSPLLSPLSRIRHQDNQTPQLLHMGHQVVTSSPTRRGRFTLFPAENPCLILRGANSFPTCVKPGCKPPQCKKASRPTTSVKSRNKSLRPQDLTSSLVAPRNSTGISPYDS